MIQGCFGDNIQGMSLIVLPVPVSECICMYILLYVQVYISQILVASALGAVVEAVGSVRVIPAVASGGSFLGFLSACFLVDYPEPGSSDKHQALSAESDEIGDRGSQRLSLLQPAVDHSTT